MTESFKEFVKLRIAESGGWFWGTTKKSLAQSLSYQCLLKKHENKVHVLCSDLEAIGRFFNSVARVCSSKKRVGGTDCRAVT